MSQMPQNNRCTEKDCTLHPREHGYPNVLRQQAVQTYIDRMDFRRIACPLGVHHQSVINWVNAYAA